MESSSIEIPCSKVAELASEYVEGALSAPLARAVADHARACATCESDLRALREVWTELDALPEV